jgi:hypothetical protein
MEGEWEDGFEVSSIYPPVICWLDRSRYLDSSIHLSYVLLRMLERWGKNKGDVYVRKRARKKARRKRE